MIFYPQHVYYYFSENYVLSKRSAKGWFNFDCPFCGKEKKAAFHPVIQYVKCWVCGAASNVTKFVEEVEGLDYYDAKQRIINCKPSEVDLDILNDIEIESTVVNITLPNGWQSILDGKGNLGDRARKNLVKRGFDLEELDAKGFGYCNKHHEDYSRDFYGYIIVPFKKDGLLSYYIGRDFMGNELRYKNPPADWCGVGKSEVIYNEEALSLYKTIYTMEGWSDAEAVGVRGTATLGWNWSGIQLNKYMQSKAKNIVFIPDAGTDAAHGDTYYKLAVRTAMQFLETDKRIYVIDLNAPQFDDILTPDGKRAKDVCEIGWSNIKPLVKQTTVLTWTSAMEIITQ